MTTTTTERAEAFARQWHAGQFEKFNTGVEYVFHLARVAALVDGEEAKQVAWLHDVLEDTRATVEDLVDLGVSPNVVAAVQLLTRNRGDTYEAYIDYIQRSAIRRELGGLLALEGKIADLQDHLRPQSPPIPESYTLRYERALSQLIIVRDNFCAI